MDRMPGDPESVVEFGTTPSRSRFASTSRFTFLRELGTDRRLPVLVAGLGGFAVFASLISEWQVTKVEAVRYGDGETGDVQLLATDLIDLGGTGGAYLGGLFLLVVAVVLALFGPAAGRRWARLAGFGVGGLLLALLLAMVQLLSTETRLVSRYFTISMDLEQTQVDYGRGLWCALFGVAAGLVALWLTGREPGDDDGPRWRRTPVEDDEPDLDEPLDLSISPATPFARFTGPAGEPHRS